MNLKMFYSYCIFYLKFFLPDIIDRQCFGSPFVNYHAHYQFFIVQVLLAILQHILGVIFFIYFSGNLIRFDLILMLFIILCVMSKLNYRSNERIPLLRQLNIISFPLRSTNALSFSFFTLRFLGVALIKTTFILFCLLTFLSICQIHCYYIIPY